MYIYIHDLQTAASNPHSLNLRVTFFVYETALHLIDWAQLHDEWSFFYFPYLWNQILCLFL